MKSLNFVWLIALFTFCSGEKLCPRSSYFFRTTVFTDEQPIASHELASKYLKYPNIIPLLFGNFISNYKKASTYTALLTRGKEHKIVVAYSYSRYATLTIVNHDRKAFPVRLLRSKILVYATKKSKGGCAKLRIKFVGPHISHPGYARARNIYARAFVKMLLENARLVLGLGACSTSLSSITGICNNPFHPQFGCNFAKQLRPWSGPTLKLSDELPNPRYVSNELCRSRTQYVAKNVAKNNINLLLVMFGQFMDHDLILTPSGRSSSRTYSFDLPPGDVRVAKMSITRSDPLPYSPGKCCDNPYSPNNGEWNQFNRITSFVDASTIYGSDHERAMVLRSFNAGKLITSKTDRGELLPRNNYRELLFPVLNANKMDNEKLYVSGDVRANENPVLLSLHTIFAREHNRICDLLAKALTERFQKSESDEWLYQTARKIVIGELQNIVFNEFVPLMVGENALGPYSGYKSEVDATIDIMFTTAAFRWGHSALRNSFLTKSLDNESKSYELHQLFFKSGVFDTTNIEDWLLGAIYAPAGAVNLEHADAVRDFLFSLERGVRDLAATNIARGRDHGLPGYLAARKAYGLHYGLGMSDIAPAIRGKIMQVYKSVHHIDPFIGGLAETPVEGAVMGPFFCTVVADQFKRLRDGDRFYYENVEWGDFVGSLDIVKKIKSGQVRFMDIIKMNTRIKDKHVQERHNAFQTPPS